MWAPQKTAHPSWKNQDCALGLVLGGGGEECGAEAGVSYRDAGGTGVCVEGSWCVLGRVLVCVRGGNGGWCVLRRGGGPGVY